MHQAFPICPSQTPTQLVWMSCHGENPADKENIGPVEYHPHQGFPKHYFPYKNQPGYHPPLVAIVFKQPNSEATCPPPRPVLRC